MGQSITIHVTKRVERRPGKLIEEKLLTLIGYDGGEGCHSLSGAIRVERINTVDGHVDHEFSAKAGRDPGTGLTPIDPVRLQPVTLLLTIRSWTS